MQMLEIYKKNTGENLAQTVLILKCKNADFFFYSGEGLLGIWFQIHRKSPRGELKILNFCILELNLFLAISFQIPRSHPPGETKCWISKLKLFIGI